MESMSALNFYGQLMTLLFFVWSTNGFLVFLEFFFRQRTSNFLFDSSEYFKVRENLKSEKEFPSAALRV